MNENDEWDARDKFAIILDHIKGEPEKEILKKFGLKRKTFISWKKQFHENGHKAFEDNSELIRKETEKLKWIISELL